MRYAKYNRALTEYTGFRGPLTIAAVENPIKSVLTGDDIKKITGKIYGKIMTIANNAYHKGKTDNLADMWAYDGLFDCLIGVGKYHADLPGGEVRQDGHIEITSDTVTITDNFTGAKTIYRKTQ